MVLGNEQKSLIQASKPKARETFVSIEGESWSDFQLNSRMCVLSFNIVVDDSSVCFTKDGEHVGTASSGHWRQCSSSALPWLGALYWGFQTLDNNWSEQEEAARQSKGHDKPRHWSDSPGSHVHPLEHDLPPGSTGSWICSLWPWITSNGRICGFWDYGPGTLFWLWDAGAPQRLLGPKDDRERHFILFLSQLQAINRGKRNGQDTSWRPGTWPRISGEFLNLDPYKCCSQELHDPDNTMMMSTCSLPVYKLGKGWWSHFLSLNAQQQCQEKGWSRWLLKGNPGWEVRWVFKSRSRHQNGYRIGVSSLSLAVTTWRRVALE